MGDRTRRRPCARWFRSARESRVHAKGARGTRGRSRPMGPNLIDPFFPAGPRRAVARPPCARWLGLTLGTTTLDETQREKERQHPLIETRRRGELFHADPGQRCAGLEGVLGCLIPGGLPAFSGFTDPRLPLAFAVGGGGGDGMNGKEKERAAPRCLGGGRGTWWRPKAGPGRRRCSADARLPCPRGPQLGPDGAWQLTGGVLCLRSGLAAPAPSETGLGAVAAQLITGDWSQGQTRRRAGSGWVQRQGRCGATPSTALHARARPTPAFWAPTRVDGDAARMPWRAENRCPRSEARIRATTLL